MNKYLVCKGWEGFCDRLQVVATCIEMGIRYNRILCVDWSDDIWTHNHLNFFDYFDLVDIPYVSNVEDIPPDLDVFPKFWQGALTLRHGKWIHKLKDELQLDPQKKLLSEAVWVHQCVGTRTFNFRVLGQHISLKKELIDLVTPYLASIPKDLPLVHLRGTDRECDEESWSKLRKEAPIGVIVSDDLDLAARWMSESPESVVLSSSMVSGKKGSHFYDRDSLKTKNITKRELNEKMLMDFVALASAEEAYSLHEKSLFFKMARFFRACGGIPRLLTVAPEPEIHPTSKLGYNFLIRPTT